jgi:glycosyltransferase involved in cell wall biosynthesis
MRILHVINSVNPAGGGPIEGVRQLAAVNRDYGHIVEVASTDAPDRPYLNSLGIPVYALGPGSMKYSYCSRLVPWLKNNVKNYDIVVVNGLWQYHSLAVWRVLRGGDLPYVVFTHGMLDPWFKKAYPLKHLKKMLYWPWAEYRVLRDASAVLFTCEEERRLARQSFALYRCNEVVVKYGTAGPPGDVRSELEAFYETFPQLRGKRLATFIGRLHTKKGCDLLIEAFARVLARDADWHLLMCGPDQVGWQGTLLAQAQGINISDRITWAGMVGGALKWGALRASEIFVLPSHQENFGIAVSEALACGTPALIANKVNIWREVRDSGAGLVAKDDLEGTCALLKSWIELSPEQQLQMRKNARECFLRDFDIHHASRTLVETLANISMGKDAYAKAS